MRKSRLLGLALLAGVVASGGVFTASNTFTNTTNIAGYGADTVTGATVSNISYAHATLDSSKLASVTFTLTTNVTGAVATMQLLNSSGAAIGSSPYSCTLGTWSVVSSSMTATCNTSDNPLITSVVTVGLMVHQ
jgi:hypothetical protein